jgi:hypothetical protein
MAEHPQESERGALWESRQEYIELAERRLIEELERTAELGRVRRERDHYWKALERLTDALHVAWKAAREALDG